MRANRYVGLMLGISRRQADKLILDGHIIVNDQVCKITDQLSESDLIKLDNKPINKKVDLIYLILNKPTGYVCSRKGQGSHTIYDLLPEKYQSLNYVGRLDKNSCGLLLLTNDGIWHYQLTHPKYQKIKIYQVILNKPLDIADKLKIEQEGVHLEDGISKFEISPKSNWINIKIYEGRNRQIRNTFKALGYNVSTLKRVQFGPYKLGNLFEGQWQLTSKK